MIHVYIIYSLYEPASLSASHTAAFSPLTNCHTDTVAVRAFADVFLTAD